MLWEYGYVAILLAAGTDATRWRNMHSMELGRRGNSEMDELPMPMLEKRQSNSVSLSPTAMSMNMTAWNATTAEACMKALSSMNAASNPSGTAVCYNIPSLNMSSGSFVADLRLFQVSEPSGAFSGIPAQKIQVGLQYHGASVTPINQSSLATRDDESLSSIAKRSTPTPLQTYMFSGKIDAAQMQQPMTMGTLEALLVPSVVLKGVDATGQTVQTNVSSNEASFVNGIFSTEVILSQTAMAQLAVNDVVAGLANGTVAFILPGVQIMIFPVGLTVTSIWMVVGVGFYVFGTMERINYRDTFRRRKVMVNKPSAAARI